MLRTSGICIILAVGSVVSSPAWAKKTIVPESAEERLQLLQTADVWQPTDTSNFDMFQGVDDTFKWGQTVRCSFMEPDREDPPGGFTPKFKCLDESGDDLKVKYGLRNGEVYAEVMASRLLQALGFGADRYYPVRVECQGCPQEPWTYIRDVVSGEYQRLNRLSRYHANRTRYRHKFEKWEKKDRIFVPAIIEKKFEGPRIEQHDDQGWGWDEFAVMDQLTKDQRVHRQALAALMGMLQHADNKAEQQRIHCPKEETFEVNGRTKCRKAFLIVHDVGYTFGHGWRFSMESSKAVLSDWRDEPVFEDIQTCKINIHNMANDGFIFPRSMSTWVDVYLSEEARQFLVGRLRLLSRQQIEDLFRASRIKMQQPIVVGGIPDTVVYQWADTLEAKINELASIRCPPMEI